MTLRETLDRYAEVFGEWPPLIVWSGSDDQLQELAERAIKDEKALTEEDLIRATGGEPAPEGALY